MKGKRKRQEFKEVGRVPLMFTMLKVTRKGLDFIPIIRKDYWRILGREVM